MQSQTRKVGIAQSSRTYFGEAGNHQKEAEHLLHKYRRRYRGDRTDDDIKDLVAGKIISNYSCYSAFSGGATALSGVIPGLGTVISTFGGGTADMALCMKFQIEMTMAIATVYEHNTLEEEERRLSFMLAALGTITKAAKEGAAQVGTKAFVSMARQYLKGATLVTTKQLFKKVGVTFTRISLEKAAPFGVGVVLSFSANKGLTWYVGTRIHDFFKTI